MKKLGFIALALVTLLATLGIGFSMWSQTITITGNVNTGNVTLQVSNYTGTTVYKDAGGLLVSATGALPMGTVPTAPGGALWGPAYAYVQSVVVGGVTYTDNAAHSCTSNSGLTVNLAYHNLFPVPLAANQGFMAWTADFDVTNTGSIPVKLEISPVSTTNATSSPNGGMPAISVTYANGGTIANAEGYQIEPNGVVHVYISLTVNEQTVQSYNGSFSLTISGVQWNEYRTANVSESVVPRT
jgi:hypothetical protein